MGVRGAKAAHAPVRNCSHGQSIVATFVTPLFLCISATLATWTRMSVARLQTSLKIVYNMLWWLVLKWRHAMCTHAILCGHQTRERMPKHARLAAPNTLYTHIHWIYPGYPEYHKSFGRYKGGRAPTADCATTSLGKKRCVPLLNLISLQM